MKNVFIAIDDRNKQAKKFIPDKSVILSLFLTHSDYKIVFQQPLEFISVHDDHAAHVHDHVKAHHG